MYNMTSKDILHNLTIEQKIGQLLYIGLPGTQIGDAEQKLLDDIQPGGFIVMN